MFLFLVLENEWSQFDTTVSLEFEATGGSLQPDPMGASLEVGSVRTSLETEATGAGLALGWTKSLDPCKPVYSLGTRGASLPFGWIKTHNSQQSTWSVGANVGVALGSVGKWGAYLMVLSAWRGGLSLHWPAWS